MRIVSDERLIQRNTKIGKYATLAGMGLLVAALVINILALTRPADASLLTYVIAAFFVGFTLTNIGSVLNNRWGRRPDRGLAEALKGLDERYTLYNYELGAAHVLAGPSGVYILHPKYQSGPITFTGKKWVNPTARRTFFGLFNPDPLGNPVLEAAGETQAFDRYVKKQAPELDVDPQPIVVFMHPRAEVNAKDVPIPALHFKQLKDYIRKQPKTATFSPQALAAAAKGHKPAPNGGS